jgi:hypothetical protein
VVISIKFIAAFISFTIFAYLTTKFKETFPETYTFGEFLQNKQTIKNPPEGKADNTTREMNDSPHGDIGDGGE